MYFLNKYDFGLSDSSDSDELTSDNKTLTKNDTLILSRTNLNQFLNTTNTSTFSANNTKSGILWKEADNILKTWQPRFFRVTDPKLEYFHDPSDTIPAGIINFSQVSATLKLIPKASPEEIHIRVAGVNYSMVLKASSLKELLEWAQSITQVILKYERSPKSAPTVTLGEKFWKFERITESEFSSSVETGDILLFRSKDLSAKIQRGLTNSKYDHIALLLCYSSGKIYLLEATQCMGVSLTGWDNFIVNNWQDYYEGIAYRNLMFDRNEEVLLKLVEFVEKVNGKDYGLNPKKLLTKGSFRQPGDEKDFFCSELVASAYKALGVISSSRTSRAFFPGSFAKDKTLDLINAKLSNIKLIMF